MKGDRLDEVREGEENVRVTGARAIELTFKFKDDSTSKYDLSKNIKYIMRCSTRELRSFSSIYFRIEDRIINARHKKKMKKQMKLENTNYQ